MDNKNLYHPSILKLYEGKYKKMNYNLLISVFGLNRGIRLIKSQHLSHQMFQLSLMIPSSNLILSQEIKEKFETKNAKFVSLTRDVLGKINRKSTMQRKDQIRLGHKLSYQSNSYQRYMKSNNHQMYKYNVFTIIIIQKNIRGYFGRKNVLQVINSIIREKSTKFIVAIQSSYRKYSLSKRMKISTLIKKIVELRKDKGCEIINLFSSYRKVIKEKQQVIVDIVIGYRRGKIMIIQNYFRTYRLVKLVKTIIAYEKSNYVLEYPFYAKKIQIKVYFNTSLASNAPYQFLNTNLPKYKIYSFEFCRLRQLFVLYIRSDELVSGKYRCQLIVDGCVTCDGRFPHIECEDGQFYNLIEFTQGKAVASGNTKKTNGSDNESKGSSSDKAKKGISSDEEDKKTYATLKKNLAGNPPVCLYDKTSFKNLDLDTMNESQEDFFKNLK